jgi:hypothetical protein
MRRPEGQSQFSAALNVQAAATPKLRTLVSEIAGDPSGDLSLPALAGRAAMTERTFSRVFHKEVGITPAAFVESARVIERKPCWKARIGRWRASRSGRAFGALILCTEHSWHIRAPPQASIVSASGPLQLKPFDARTLK